MKPKVAFFDFASCEGCQLALLNCEEILLDILNLITWWSSVKPSPRPRRGTI